MNITITKPALQHFQSDWNFRSGDTVRIFPRYGGLGKNAFSLGIRKDEPQEIGLEVTLDNIRFFIEKDDMWYLEEQDVKIDFDEKIEEIVFPSA
ncbi:HesB/YadR/YfhF family protein [Brevibacillus dissolubilis]|uniref:HesB/YadR/YfhF family protein n=1 Tax=Brevibacillus dissolubilis TaxID=1844116 RepID=UPI001116B6EA|nr:hypothetical protein [Brevibacillus dissolubilis]